MAYPQWIRLTGPHKSEHFVNLANVFSVKFYLEYFDHGDGRGQVETPTAHIGSTGTEYTVIRGEEAQQLHDTLHARADTVAEQKRPAAIEELKQKGKQK